MAKSSIINIPRNSRLNLKLDTINGFDVKYVSVLEIRNTKDPDYGVIGSSKIFPYIPENEIWFDPLYNEEKGHFFKVHFRELELMAKEGIGYEQARAKIEEEFDKKNKNANIPDYIMKTKRYGLFRVDYVDGRIIRKYIDPKFILGCHEVSGKESLRRLQDRKIWIDMRQEPKEYAYTLIHEYIEANLMLTGMDFNDAHDYALAVEKGVRRKDGAKYPKD